MKLVIVESPHKCETIGKYLGKGYKVMASIGHLDDLATSGKGGFGIDPDNGFKANYVIDKDKIKTVNELKKAVKASDEVILATDPDREGEAIAWHLAKILGLDPLTTKRLEFHEITSDSINYAIEHPRTINMNLVDSQETRRIMDRVIGFKLSSILQKRIKSRSAGRVQSATLKFIYDHDKEIKDFKSEEYWTLSLLLKKDNLELTANYVPNGNKKISNKEENDEILSKIGKTVNVKDVKKSFRSVESKPAFTTSTMQQEAFNMLHMSTATTTRVAQILYEGVNLGNEHVGLVTYIRTDNTSLSNSFVAQAKEFIINNYGKEYVGSKKISKVKGAQNAHEAIRPTSLYRTPESIKHSLTNDQYRLYKLIYDRALASLMSAKKDEVETIVFETNGLNFKCDFVKNIFNGYTKIYQDEENKHDTLLSNINVGDEFGVSKINNKQEFTKPPLHYSEAKIVKLMEEKGIGRPSTYASTIKTLKTRKYIESQSSLIVTTEQGEKTAFVLNKYFPRFVDAKYTALMEQDLDKIQEGTETKLHVLTDFYYPFIKECDDIYSKMYDEKPEEVGRNCPICGKPLVYKESKYGRFIGCSNFPTCSYTENDNTPVYAGGNCPICGKPLVVKYTKNHKKFIGCSGYPECTYIQKNSYSKKEKIVVKKCPECGGDLIVRYYKKKKILGCSNYPKCQHMEAYVEEKKEK